MQSFIEKRPNRAFKSYRHKILVSSKVKKEVQDAL